MTVPPTTTSPAGSAPAACRRIRVGSGNTAGAVRRALTLDYRIDQPAAALERLDRSIERLEEMAHRAGQAGCDVLCLPEDVLGTAAWEGANPGIAAPVLREAEARLLGRLGQAAASHRMYLICCNDTVDDEGGIRNTAVFLGRDGRPIGRYHKVSLPVQEHLKLHGAGFPVFQTPDLGGVGILICYDMVFPESARCLALAGADLIFHPTVGGAAFGGADISRAAFRTRAVENFVYLVVSWGAWGEDQGSMVVSPLGEILVEQRRGGELAVADIDPFAGRGAADWSNEQEDMRVRLFRERRPSAYAVLTDPQPPGLRRLPDLRPGLPEEIARMVQRATTEGHARFEQAESMRRAGRHPEAAAAYASLIADYPRTWFDRTARQRLAELQGSAPGGATAASGDG